MITPDVFSIFMASLFIFFMELFGLLFLAWLVIKLIAYPIKRIFSGIRGTMRKV